MARGDVRLRFHIAGHWSADDFALLFRASDDIYNLATVLAGEVLRDRAIRSEMFPLDRRRVRRIASRLTNRPWLDVTAISFASPGKIDLLGVGEVVKQIKEFTLGLMDRYQSRDFRKLDLKEKLRLADKAAFDDELSRTTQLALARHDEQVRELELSKLRLRVERRQLQNNTLQLSNLDEASNFVQKMSRAFKDNDLTAKEMKQIGTWLDSRAKPVSELVELRQIVDVEITEE